MKLTLSTRIYISLIIILAVLAGISVFLPISELLSSQELPISKPVIAIANAGIILIVYGGLGFIGLILSQKLGFANIWDPNISNGQRFLIPALIGICLGIFLILADMIFSRFHDLGAFPHPPFSASLVASATAGIGEEVIFRLFFISFWVWLISYVILKNKWQNLIFWIITIISAFAFAMGHIPSVILLFNFNSFTDFPPALLSEIILLNGVFSLFAAYYFRKYGFLAAVGIHFWADVVWHVIWGVV